MTRETRIRMRKMMKILGNIGMVLLLIGLILDFDSGSTIFYRATMIGGIVLAFRAGMDVVMNEVIESDGTKAIETEES